MKDLRIAQPYSLLGFEEMTRDGNFFRFKGPEDYSTVVMVVVNDFVIEELALYGQDLLAYISEELDDTTDISYVALIAQETEFSDETMLRLGFGVIPTEVEGSDRLVQLFVKVLFQTPGSDIYNKTVGGGLLRIKKRGSISGDLNAVSAEVAAAIDKTDKDIRSMQSGLVLPAEERLVKAEILHIRPDYKTNDINVLVHLRTLAGTEAYFNVAA
jgi:hypothetical protein